MSARHARPTRAQSRAGAYALQPQPAWVCPDRVREPARPYHRGGRPGPTPRRRLLRAAQQMLATSAAISAVAMIGVVGSSETFALWSGGVEIDGGSLTSGTAALAVDGGALALTNALPGEQEHSAFAIENEGSVPLDVTMRVAATQPGFGLHARIFDTAVDCSQLATTDLLAIGTVPTTESTPIQDDELLQVCAIITADPTVAPDAAASFTLIFDGVQAP